MDFDQIALRVATRNPEQLRYDSALESLNEALADLSELADIMPTMQDRNFERQHARKQTIKTLKGLVRSLESNVNTLKSVDNYFDGALLSRGPIDQA